MKSKCYIAGPMTGYPGFNYEAFDEARDVLRRRGWDVISPADLDRENLGIDFSKMEGTEDLSQYRTAFARQDIAALLDVHAVFVLDGWEASTGARNELTLAAMLGVPIFTFPETTPVEWVAHFSNAPLPETVEESLDDWAEYVDKVVRHTSDECGLGDRCYTPHADGEVRVVDPDTGGEKGSKLARMELLPVGALRAIAEHFGRGAEKYEARNWERGYAWSLSYGALLRHLLAWWGGEDHDPELGSHHLDAVGFHVLALRTFVDTHPEKDDRPR
jgi:hypothetical protein